MKPASLHLEIVRGITFGPVILNCQDSGGTAVDLTGWSVAADARQNPSKPVAFSLCPRITNAANGQITIGASAEQTDALPVGAYRWDLVLTRPTGERLGPYIGGAVTVAVINTRRT